MEPSFATKFNRVCCYCLDGGTDRLIYGKVYPSRVRSK